MPDSQLTNSQPLYQNQEFKKAKPERIGGGKLWHMLWVRLILTVRKVVSNAAAKWQKRQDMSTQAIFCLPGLVFANDLRN